MKKNLLTLLALCLYSLGTWAQSFDAYEKHQYISTDGDTLNYRLLVPENIQSGKKYPLVLFLHGAGERGNDNELQLFHGGQMWLNPVVREEYPAFILVPQCPKNGYWAYSRRPKSFNPSEMPAEPDKASVFNALKQLIDTHMAKPEVDKSRIYIMGLSMGAMGTFDMVIRHPELFAAAVPICGTVNPERLAATGDVKFRIYHGDKDPVVPVEGSRQAYRALKAAGKSVIYIEYPGVEHDSWNRAFNDPEFMKWMFSQKK